MKKEKMVAGFNAWMDEYINHPEKFNRRWESIRKHLSEKSNGEEPSYGQRCEVALSHYAKGC